MEYQTIYNKENTRIKFLAFVIIMPAYIDVLNVLLNTIGIGMTSVVTACIYIYVLISLILKCGIRKIDFFYLIGFYLVFLLNYVFFSSTGCNGSRLPAVPDTSRHPQPWRSG